MLLLIIIHNISLLFYGIGCFIKYFYYYSTFSFHLSYIIMHSTFTFMWQASPAKIIQKANNKKIKLQCSLQVIQEKVTHCVTASNASSRVRSTGFDSRSIHHYFQHCSCNVQVVLKRYCPSKGGGDHHSVASIATSNLLHYTAIVDDYCN